MLHIVAAALIAQAQPPGASPSDRPAELPMFSGALKFADPVDVEVLPHALDAGWKGEDTCELLQETAEALMFKCTFEPGQGHERHFHNAHVGYVVSGGKMRITDQTGTREQEIPTGASWTSDGVPWHEAVNIGDTTASYVIIEPKGASE
ncbi:MAG: hypothetical protein AAF668_02605 [Pseudomonadota bacterium]